MVKEAEKKWAAAVTKNDFAALEKLFAEELIYTHSNGASDSKREFIDNLKNGVRKYEAMDYDSTTVKIAGNTALLSAKGTLRVVTKGQKSEFKIVFLHTYVKRKDGWQLLGHQSARLP